MLHQHSAKRSGNLGLAQEAVLPQYIFKRGNSYAVRFTIPRELHDIYGKKEVIRSLGTSDLGAAVVKRDEVIEAIQRDLQEPKPKARETAATLTENPYMSDTTISATAHRWLVQSDGIKNATKARYRQHLRAFAEYAKDIEVAQIDRKLALAFIEYLKVTPSERTGEKLSVRSIGSYQVCLSAWWRVLDHWGLVDPDMRNPFSSLLRRVAGQKKKIDLREKNLRPVTREEAEALLAYIAGKDSLFYQREMFVTVRLLWATACRLNEICGRRLEDLDDRGDHIRITIPEGNNRGMTFTNIGGLMHFLFRDEKSRARYVFEAMMGLTWPITVGFLERLELYQRFEDGWTSGELGFLSGVPLADVDLYREAMAGKLAVSQGIPAVLTSDQPQ